MKFSLVFLLLIDIPHLKGQQRIEEFEHILLRLAFPSVYNSYSKSCCKLYPGGCYKLLDSTGYTCDLLRGRVTKTESDGWIEFKIASVQIMDGGYYRCIVLGTENHIYKDYYVEVLETSGHHREASSHNTESQLPLTTTITSITSITVPDSTGPALAEDHSDSPSVTWILGLPLAAIVSITVMIFISSVIGVMCCRMQTKRKQLDKYGETLCESLKQEAPETSSVLYTTVDFTAQQKPSDLYANLRIYKTQAGAANSTWSKEDAGMVEYSTLAIHQLKCN